MDSKKTETPLYLLKKVRDSMIEESGAKTPLETGGILIGKNESNIVTITHALGPGPKAQHGVCTFKRDGQYSQQELETIFSSTQGQRDYVGEWHSHPAQCDASNIDRGSIGWISQNSSYDCKHPVLVIPFLLPGNGWDLMGYRWDNKKLCRCPIEIIDMD